MPRIDPRPFGGRSYSGGVYGTPANPMEWQHQPGDHSDTRILPLLTPLSGTAGVAFGFSTSATGTQTFTGTAAVAFGFSTSATGTQTVAGDTTFCDYDYAGDTYDNADDTYDCSGAATADPAFLPLIVSPAPAEDDGDDLLLMVAVMRSRLRL